MKRGWCDANPVARVEAPQVMEQQVPILTPQEIEQITTTAEKYQDGSCAAAVGMMLYAGIRPHEVARLTWAQVDLQERAIYILPRHSKTGMAAVTICSDFGAPQNSLTVSTVLPSICHEVMGQDAMILVS